MNASRLSTCPLERKTAYTAYYKNASMKSIRDAIDSFLYSLPHNKKSFFSPLSTANLPKPSHAKSLIGLILSTVPTFNQIQKRNAFCHL